MNNRNLTIARLVEDHIDGVEIEGDAFGDLLSSLGVVPKIERTVVVTSSEAGGETRAYLVEIHTVPGTDGTARVYACTCPAFRFHELPEPSEIEADPEAGFESIGTCKHGEKVAIADRSTETREADQQGFDTFASRGGSQ